MNDGLCRKISQLYVYIFTLINHRLQNDIIVEMLAGKARSIWLTVLRVANTNFPILIHFNTDTFCTSNQDMRNSQFDSKILRNKMPFQWYQHYFWEICWRASSVCRLAFAELCGTAYADWVPCVHFNHKSFDFLWIHLFRSKCFMFLIFNAHSLVFHYIEYDEWVRSSSIQWQRIGSNRALARKF